MNTDRAWSLLYSRLQQEGLIPGEEEKSRKLRPSFLKWMVAAMLVSCAGLITLTLLQKKESDSPAPLVTLHNEKGLATLATTLDDGSIVYLATDARLYYPERFTPDKREVSFRGRALFDVTGNRQCPFLIQTGTAQVEVTGTLFNLQSLGDQSFELSVKEGEVKVTWIQSGQSRYAGAGETILLSPSGRLRVGATTADSNVFNPYRGQIRFKDEKLANILRVINNQGANTRLQTTAALENRKITATFTDVTPEKVAELLCVAFNLLCKRENDALLITEP